MLLFWGSGVKTGEAKRLNTLFRESSSVLGVILDPLEEVGGHKNEEQALLYHE